MAWGASHRTVTPKVSLRYPFIHLGAKTQSGKTTIFFKYRNRAKQRKDSSG